MLLLSLLFSVSLHVCVVLISVRSRLKAETTITAQFIFTKDSFLTIWLARSKQICSRPQLFSAIPHSISSQVPVSLLHSPLCHLFPCSARLCLSEVYCVECEGGSLALQRAGGQIPNTRHLTSVSEDVRSDTWLLNCPPRGLSEQQSAQTQWSMGKEEERERKRRRRLTAETTMYCASILSFGRTIEWKLTVLQWFAVQLGIVLNTSTMLHVDSLLFYFFSFSYFLWGSCFLVSEMPQWCFFS